MADFGDARDLVLDLNIEIHGMDMTVTRPAPDDTPIATRGIWLTTETMEVPAGGGFVRREPYRVLAFSRRPVPTLPEGTLIQAPERMGGTPETWVVDGHHQTFADHYRAIVKRPEGPRP